MGIFYLSTETVTCLGTHIYITYFPCLQSLVVQEHRYKGGEWLSASHLAFLILFDYLYTERVNLYILDHRKNLKDKNPQSNLIDLGLS